MAIRRSCSRSAFVFSRMTICSRSAFVFSRMTICFRSAFVFSRMTICSRSAFVFSRMPICSRSVFVFSRMTICCKSLSLVPGRPVQALPRSVGCGRRSATTCPAQLYLFDGTDALNTTSRCLSSVASEFRRVSRAASDGRHLVFRIRPLMSHAPKLYSNNVYTNVLYKRSRSCSLTCCLRSQRDHINGKQRPQTFSARQVLNVSEQGVPRAI